ncbi:MAG: CDP-glycerol glycerophosphotransferase family protein [Candidatus Nanopelagicales bacterium]
MGQAGRRFSVVTAMSGDEQLSDEFLASLTAQTFPLDQIQLVAVVDTSSTASTSKWDSSAKDLPISVKVVESSGLSKAEALNLGINEATGEWITFPNATDLYDENFFAAVNATIESHDEIDTVAAKVSVRDGVRNRDRRTPRSYMFDDGDQIVDLLQSPQWFPYSATSTIFRRSLVSELDIRFDPKLQPNFADVKFSSEFVLRSENSVVAFVESAQYIWRLPKGLAGLRQQYLSDSGHFEVVPRRGLLALLELAQEKLGQSPPWLNGLVLAELDPYFRSEELLNQDTAATGGVANAFLETVQKIADLLDDEIVSSYRPHRSKGPWPEFLLHGLRGEDWHLPYVIESGNSKDQDALKVTYNFSGSTPSEIFEVDGQPVEPLAAKIRSYRYFEHDVHYERIVWLPIGDDYQVTLNGTKVPAESTYLGPLGDLDPPIAKQQKDIAKQNDRKEQFKVDSSAWKIWNHTFKDAWLICDRLHNASDNGEVLFKYLRKNRRDINAWFIIAEDTPDYERLKAEGYGRRLLNPGSYNWHKAMRRAKYLVSSHAAKTIVDPPDIEGRYETRFEQVFLQHGVITRDMSNWLNRRDTRLFITSTPQEYASIAGDYTGYKFTTRETKLTGLPRFDEHLRVDQVTPERDKNLVLVAPTWRHWLTQPVDETGRQSRQVSEDLMSSEFVQQWLKVLSSEELAKAVKRNRLEIAFLPHPNFYAALDMFDLPSHVKLVSFTDQTPQSIFARTRLLITDYSSVASDLSFLGRPSVYFQFDHELIDAGGHNGKPGYFNYDALGYGPVAYDSETAINHIVGYIETDCAVPEQYQIRMDAAFPLRDGKCTERVVTEIEGLA